MRIWPNYSSNLPINKKLQIICKIDTPSGFRALTNLVTTKDVASLKATSFDLNIQARLMYLK
jgi:hypothetical protein